LLDSVLEEKEIIPKSKKISKEKKEEKPKKIHE
jgi:hypothetical protein